MVAFDILKIRRRAGRHDGLGQEHRYEYYMHTKQIDRRIFPVSFELPGHESYA